MATKIKGNRRIAPASIGSALFDTTVLDGSNKILLSLLPASLVSGLKNPTPWDASAGAPVGSQEGDTYRVTVAGVVATVDYEVGDLAIYTGGTLVKVDNSDKVSSVNTKIGAVVLNTDDIAETGTPTNKWYTSARANADFDTRLATKTTDNLTEGTTNLYFTVARAKAAAVKNTINASGALVTDVALSESALMSLFKGPTVASGTLDAVNKVFTLTGEWLQASLTVYVGRVVMSSADYTYSFAAGTTTITLGASVDAPDSTEDVLVSGVKLS